MSMIAKDTECPRHLIDKHFAGTIRPAKERTLRAHLAACAACREYYDRHLLLAQVDPTRALSAKERLARGLGIALERPALPSLRWAVVLSSAALATVVLWHSLPVSRPPEPAQFTARGPAKPAVPLAPTVQAYRLSDQQAGSPVKESITATDELAFTYRNPQGRKYLLIFGVDNLRQVYWYYPAWTDKQSKPTAVPVVKTDAAVELPSAIRHTIRGNRLHLYSVFSDRALAVDDIERIISHTGAPPLKLPLSNVTQSRILLDVSHDAQ